MRRLPGLVVTLVTRARIRIVKRLLERQPLQTIPVALCCGIECPSAEDLAVYIDNRLAGNQRMEIDEGIFEEGATVTLLVLDAGEPFGLTPEQALAVLKAISLKMAEARLSLARQAGEIP
ncbi:MAG TPA: hypothetical protein VF173_05855 [Thermoanaerobaculia bacterium]|nr:hypothetical protein [Thermoanaerobaculia bacterium]